MARFLVIVAAVLTLCLCSVLNVFAAFGDYSLIRVISDKTGGSTLEIATDLGNIDTLAAQSNVTVGGGVDIFTKFNTNSFNNLSVNYYAVQGDSFTGSLYIGTSALDPVAAGSYGTPEILQTINSYYSGLPLASGSTSTVIANNTDIHSFNAMLGDLTSYNGFAAFGNTNLPLSNLTSSSPIKMAVYHFTDIIGGGLGTKVLDLITNADGSTTINPPSDGVPSTLTA